MTEIDRNHLLIKYSIDVKGASDPVELDIRDNGIALIFTGVHTSDAGDEATKRLHKIFSEKGLSDSVGYGTTGGEYTVLLSNEAYNKEVKSSPTGP